MPRHRLLYGLLLLLVMGLGLSSRQPFMPQLVRLYAGDTLWSLMVFLLVGLFFPKLPTRLVALYAGMFSLLIELSQFYHAPWIDAIRATRIGGLVLGFGFLWRDLVCYALGIMGGVVIDVALRSVHQPHENQDG